MNAYYNEIDPYAAQWLRNLIAAGHIASGEVDERSIVDVSPDDLRGFTQCHFFAGIGGWAYALRLAGWPDDRPVWTGSPPCQPFSTAGKGLSRNDPRHLAPHFVRLVRACRPAVLFGEQVASADVFGGAAKRPRNGTAVAPEWAWIDDLSDRLEAARYAVGAVDLPAAGVGAPHIRQRTFFGAVRLAGAEGGLGHASHLHGGDGAAHRGLGGAERPLHRETWQGNGETAGVAGGNGGLADADGWHASAEGLQRQRIDRFQSQDGSSGLGASAPAGSTNHTYDSLGTDAPDSPWRDADWLFCRDDRWRPVEPGTFPLAHGVSGRVGRLRAYGNAIVPQVAATFIEAVMS